MTIYRACIKIRVNSVITNTWVHVEAQNITLAKALLGNPPVFNGAHL
jgi:hypothetical protein